MSFIFSIHTHSVVARELFKMILLSFVFQLSTVFYPQIVVHGQLQNELYTLSSVSKSDWISNIVAKYSKIKDEFSCATKCNLNVCNAWVFDNSSQTCTLGNVFFFHERNINFGFFFIWGTVLDPWWSGRFWNGIPG